MVGTDAINGGYANAGTGLVTGGLNVHGASLLAGTDAMSGDYATTFYRYRIGTSSLAYAVAPNIDGASQLELSSFAARKVRPSRLHAPLDIYRESLPVRDSVRSVRVQAMGRT